jgi:hypothetical protein
MGWMIQHTPGAYMMAIREYNNATLTSFLPQISIYILPLNMKNFDYRIITNAHTRKMFCVEP